MENKQEEVRRFEILEMLLFSDNFWRIEKNGQNS
jgi:hypothetical protein